MRLLDELRAEHTLIEAVVGSLRTFARRRAAGEASPEDGAAFVRFFRTYSAEFHHGREEDSLFPALAERTELPLDRGPLGAFLEQHVSMAGTVGALAPLLPAAVLSPEEGARLVSLADAYAEALWAHIDAENSVLLPESEERLMRAGVRDLPSRAPTAAEEEARLEGERLVAAHPPMADDAIRGEGCVVCPSYGTTCQGVEKEWWNDNEWDEFSDHLG